MEGRVRNVICFHGASELSDRTATTHVKGQGRQICEGHGVWRQRPVLLLSEPAGLPGRLQNCAGPRITNESYEQGGINGNRGSLVARPCILLLKITFQYLCITGTYIIFFKLSTLQWFNDDPNRKPRGGQSPPSTHGRPQLQGWASRALQPCQGKHGPGLVTSSTVPGLRSSPRHVPLQCYTRQLIFCILLQSLHVSSTKPLDEAKERQHHVPVFS